MNQEKSMKECNNVELDKLVWKAACALYAR